MLCLTLAAILIALFFRMRIPPPMATMRTATPCRDNRMLLQTILSYFSPPMYSSLLAESSRFSPTYVYRNQRSIRKCPPTGRKTIQRDAHPKSLPICSRQACHRISLKQKESSPAGRRIPIILVTEHAIHGGAVSAISSGHQAFCPMIQR